MAPREFQTSTKEIQTETQGFKSMPVQTEEVWPSPVSAPRQMSPFETYDFLFIRDLVNNLNKDNEVLNDSNDDLKAAFMFLLN